MTYDELSVAMKMVHLAVVECLMRKQEVTHAVVFDYAQQYGKRTCTVEHTQAAMAVMNFELINNLITEISGAERLARVKALRDVTAMPLLRCKQALEQHSWDMMAAQAYLRDQRGPLGILINERSL